MKTKFHVHKAELNVYKTKFHVHKAKLLVHKIPGGDGARQGHGMPCPYENMNAQQVDIEIKRLVASFFVSNRKVCYMDIRVQDAKNRNVKGVMMLYKFDGKRPAVGKDSYVSELANIIGDVVIGEKCYIGHGAILRGDYGRIEIGDGTAVEEGAIVHAPPGDVCRIGAKVTIGHGAVVHGKRIGDGAVVGMGSTISILSEIGEHSIVAEGAVVKWNQAIPPNVVAAGNPAKVVREISSKDREFWDAGKQLYIDLAKKYLDEGMERIE